MYIYIFLENGHFFILKYFLITQKLQQALNGLLEYKVTNPTTVSWSTFEGDLLKYIKIYIYIYYLSLFLTNEHYVK